MRDYSNSQFESRPLQGSVVDLVNQQEQINSNRRAEKLEKEKFQYLKDTREREWTDKFMQNIKESIKPIQVDNADIQSFVIAGSMKAMEEIALLSDKVRNNTATPKERAKIATLLNTSDNYKAMIGPYTKTIESLNNGSVHKDDGLINYLSNFSNAEPEFDEKGLPIIRIKDANGKVREINFNEQLKGIEGFGLIPKVDPYKGFMEFTKDIKPEETKTYDGFETTETKGVSTQLASQLAESYLYPSNKMSNALKSALKSAGFDPLNLTSDAASYALKLKDELAQQLINSKERFNKENYDWNAQQGSERNAETKRHNRASEAISQQNADTSAKNAETSRMKVLGENSVSGVITDSDSNVFRSAEKKWGKLTNAFVPQKPIEMGTLNIQGKDFQDVKVYGISYDKNGNAVVEIDSENADEFGGSKTRNKTAVKISKQTEAKIANSIGLSSENLRNEIRNTQTTNNDPLGIL